MHSRDTVDFYLRQARKARGYGDKGGWEAWDVAYGKQVRGGDIGCMAGTEGMAAMTACDFAFAPDLNRFQTHADKTKPA